jgi:maleylacetoacetate isomerase/maleylpyruvate isomerase
VSLRLHSYWRATAPYRVRIGLHLKELAFEYSGVDLLANAQGGEAHAALNAQKLVPALETDDGVLTQSLAILEWLEETHPEPALLPPDRAGRARVRAMAATVACDIHPLNNMRVLKALTALGIDEGGRTAWAQGWIRDGFAALEPSIARWGAGFAYGDRPTLADCCLVPQVYSARRFGVDMAPYPHLLAAAEHAATHPAFEAAHPDRQPDARA